MLQGEAEQGGRGGGGWERKIGPEECNVVTNNLLLIVPLVASPLASLSPAWYQFNSSLADTHFFAEEVHEGPIKSFNAFRDEVR